MQKSAFRPRAGQRSYSARVEERKAMEATKAKEKEMKEEKEAERQVFIYINIPFPQLHYIHKHTVNI